jgi:hypothetical protein
MASMIVRNESGKRWLPARISAVEKKQASRLTASGDR